MRSFSIELKGHRYRGLWKPDADDGVEVRSDYGKAYAHLEGRAPGDVAREVLQRMVSNAHERFARR